MSLPVTMGPYPNKHDRELIKAFLQLSTVEEITSFLRDLCTQSEIDEFSLRFQVAKLLWTTKLTYREIAKKAGASTTTVSRVAQWLYNEEWHGYEVVLRRLYGSSSRYRSFF